MNLKRQEKQRNLRPLPNHSASHKTRSTSHAPNENYGQMHIERTNTQMVPPHRTRALPLGVRERLDTLYREKEDGKRKGDVYVHAARSVACSALYQTSA